MQVKQPGPWLFAAGIVGISIQGLLPLFEQGAPLEVSLFWVPACAIVVALGLLFRRTRAIAGGLIALFSLVNLVGTMPRLVERPDILRAWLKLAEMLAVAAAGVALVRPGLSRVACVMLGLAVALFGLAHVVDPELHASYLPDWLPVRGVWPYLTGAMQIAAGAMIMFGYRAPLAAFAVGLIWLSWIPVVLLSPALGAIGGSYQAYLMLTLLALAGSAWSVGERSAGQPGGDFQSRSH